MTMGSDSLEGTHGREGQLCYFGYIGKGEMIPGGGIVCIASTDQSWNGWTRTSTAS